MDIVAPSEHQLLVFWVQFVTILILARSLGGLMKRIGQPAVVGELTAGLLIGPSVFGAIFPDAAEWLFPADDVQSGMIFAVGWIGVVFLLIITGFETDLSLISRMGRAMAVVPIGSLLIPWGMGLLTGWWIPGRFLGEEGDRLIFMLFMATALSISALPVIAKVLTELGYMRRNFGQVTVAAAMIDDIVGWLSLGIVAGLASSGRFSFTDLGITVLSLVAFVAFAFTLGRRVIHAGMRSLRSKNAPASSWLGLFVIAALLYGSITQYIGVEVVFGAFVAGMVIGGSRARNREAEEMLEAATQSIFAPVFFATAGLRVDLTSLGDPTVLLWAGIVLVMASASKFIGTFIGAKLGRLPNREGLALAIGLNARGSLEIIVASVGLSLGVLNTDSYSILVLMAMATSMMAPPLLRLAVGDWEGEPEELERLQAEERLSLNVVVRDRPILVPMHSGANAIAAAQVVHLAWPRGVDATLMPVTGQVQEEDLRAAASVMDGRRHERQPIETEGAAEAVLAEAAMGYGVIGVGAELEPEGDRLFSEFVEKLVVDSPIPVVIVRRALNLDRPLPPAFARAVVPIGGTKASRSAQEVAFNISASLGTEIHLTHVTPEGTPAVQAPPAMNPPAAGMVDAATPKLSERLLSDAVEFASGARARVTTSARTHGSTAAGILAVVDDEGADVLVLGTHVRLVEGHLFLGHTVEQLLRECPATVIIVTTS